MKEISVTKTQRFSSPKYYTKSVEIVLFDTKLRARKRVGGEKKWKNESEFFMVLAWLLMQ